MFSRVIVAACLLGVALGDTQATVAKPEVASAKNEAQTDKAAEKTETTKTQENDDDADMKALLDKLNDEDTQQEFANKLISKMMLKLTGETTVDTKEANETTATDADDADMKALVDKLSDDSVQQEFAEKLVKKLSDKLFSTETMQEPETKDTEAAQDTKETTQKSSENDADADADFDMKASPDKLREEVRQIKRLTQAKFAAEMTLVQALEAKLAATESSSSKDVECRIQELGAELATTTARSESLEKLEADRDAAKSRAERLEAVVAMVSDEIKAMEMELLYAVVALVICLILGCIAICDVQWHIEKALEKVEYFRDEPIGN